MSHHYWPQTIAMFTRYRDTALSAHSIGVEAGLPSASVLTSDSDNKSSTFTVDFTDLAISSNASFGSDRIVTVISDTSAVPELYRPASPVDPTPDTPTITRILLSTVDGVQSGVPTLTTPTLTPTTLRNIQQTFLQASANVDTQPPETHSNQAGFVPPVVHPQPGSTFISVHNSKSLGGGIATVVDTSSSRNDFKETSTCGPPPLLPITGILSVSAASSTNSNACSMPSVAALNVSSSASSNSSDSGNEQPPQHSSNRRMGGRRPNNTAKLSEEEEQKRLVRRERNKMAAARCRKRRLDQTMTLQEETDRLEEKKSSLQIEIEQLQTQRDELQFLLATHKPVCTRSSRLNNNVNVVVTSAGRVLASSVASTRPAVVTCSAPNAAHLPGALVSDSDSEICVKEETLSDSEEQYTNSLFNSIIPRGKASVPVTHTDVPTTKFSDEMVVSKPHRPTSLAVAPLTELGVSIETPSAGLRGFNFDSMMEGGTGLTPVTPLTVSSLATGLTPLTTPIMPHPSASSSLGSSKNTTQFATQQQPSSSSELASPDSLTAKQLVSL
ncbi:transcription factor kayak isoform X2 [Hyalella azteca]|uniref:Transcription factor kayak isoform X2 n=1 Tax=Hyalella azteca TaxID=294128 RepID=A0A8B7NMH3_HYAAZ|nr:transcription factor kayak isoform X2 [Hyalella azteca]